MTNEQLNAMLYEKMAEEQSRFKKWLVSRKPEEILDHAYEFTMRESILMEMEEIDLPSKQAEGLLALPDPLAVIYKDFQKLDAVEMDVIRDCIEKRAESEAIHQNKKRQSIRAQLQSGKPEQPNSKAAKKHEQEH